MVLHESHYDVTTLFCTMAGPWSRAFFSCFAWYVMTSVDAPKSIILFCVEVCLRRMPCDAVRKVHGMVLRVHFTFLAFAVSQPRMCVGFVYPFHVLAFHSVAKRWSIGVGDGLLCDALEVQSCCCQGCTACRSERYVIVSVSSLLYEGFRGAWNTECESMLNLFIFAFCTSYDIVSEFVTSI